MFLLVAGGVGLWRGSFLHWTKTPGPENRVKSPDPKTLAKNPNPEKLVWIAPGTFTMGSPESETDRHLHEGPQMMVTLTRGFWMSKHETTQEEYQTVMGSNPSFFTDDALLPVDQVTWHEATNYCGKLTEQERRAGRLPAGYVYRLPTEAEWEYACRAGTTTRFYWGDDLDSSQLGDYAWYKDNSLGRTHPVGVKQRNPWGLYDMGGNVLEWCLDWYSGALRGGSVTNPPGPDSGSFRVVRGGSWYNRGEDCRAAARGNRSPDGRGIDFGLLPVLAPDLKSQVQENAGASR
jgi:formylglycine-generating enzyme required for sulfatase activity